MIIHVAHFQRKPLPRSFSVERLFEDVRQALPAHIRVSLSLNQYPSRGVSGRFRDAIRARRSQGEVNHVLGDVHYLTYLLNRSKTILTVLDCVSLERTRGLRRFGLWLLWYWLPVRRVSAITVISTFTRDSLLSWVRFPPERIFIIPPPLNQAFFYRPPPETTDVPRVLQVGTNENKNIPRLMEALAGLPVKLVIVGPMSDRMRALEDTYQLDIESHTRLSLDQLVEQYRQASAVAFVSTYEGFGMPIVEAQAIGRPVVTSNRCSMPEAAGPGACLVDPEDVGAIREAFSRILSDREYADRLVEAGRANVTRYAPEKIATAYAEVYERVHGWR